MTVGQLSDVCCEQNADPKRQRAAIESLLKSGADIQESDKNGVTPLHHAVRFRSPTAVETLLRHGAAADQVCKRSGSTPLHRAVMSTGAPSAAGKSTEAKQIIEILLRFGANPAIKNKRGKTPLDYVRDESIRKLLSAKRVK